MRFRNREQHLLLGIIAAILCLAVLAPQLSALAVNTVDTDRMCTLEIRLAEPGDISPDLEELRTAELTVNLYRVAEMNYDGSVTALEGYQDESVEMGIFPDDVENIEKLSGQLAAFIQEKKPEPDRTVTITDFGTVEELPTGLYMVVTEESVFGDHKYEFLPSLISLPTSGLIKGETEEDADLYPLVYEAQLFLKRARVELFGNVSIEKTLDTYHLDLGEATFVFSVEAVKNDEPVYSDVLSLTFDAPGVKYTLARHIPVGAEVTVTEIYSGASYELVSSESQTVTVLNEYDSPEPVQVEFVNTYDNSQRKGTSVVNHFERDEEHDGWAWTPVDDNEI